MLGQDLSEAAELAGHEVVAPARGELDVTDARAVGRAVERVNPDAIVNCAAYTDVDGAEADPAEALRINADGARVVARAAAKVDAAIVYPSSDYVFDGRKRSPYVESDEPRPLSAYGLSKLAGELETGAATGRHHVVRTAWLFGTGGKNFVETMLALGRARDEIAVVDDQVGSPTWTAHLAAGLVRLVESDDYGVHHVAGAGSASWYRFAREIFRRAGGRVRVTPTTTEAIGRPAPRPAFSALATEHGAVRLPDWKVGLSGYLEARTP
jgi:dTDP-4-dehydrorhamnose reductase